MTPRLGVLLGVLTTLLAACSASDATSPPEEPEPEPILDRPATPLYDCSVARPRTDYAPFSWGWSGYPLVATPAKDLFIPRVEFEGTSWSPTSEQRFVVSRLLPDGSLGPRSAVPAVANEVQSISATPGGDGFAAVWMEGPALRFAAWDGSGTLVVQPKTIPAPNLDANYAAPGLLSRGTDFALTFALGQAGTETLESSFVLLDGDGNPKGAVRKLQSNPNQYGSTSLGVHPTPQGFAITWFAKEGNDWSVYFRSLDASGADALPATRVTRIHTSVSTGFAPATLGLVEVPGGYLTAWAEYHQGEYNWETGAQHGGFSVVRVAKLDERGRLMGQPAAVRASEEHIDEVEPTLREFGDAVALSWSRGSHVYTCAGCMPDHRIDTVLIDPETLAPVSNVVTIEKRAQGGGGLLGRHVAVLDDTLTMAFQQQYHVHADPGTAALRCTAR